MKAANDNTYDPNDLPCGGMSVLHFLAEVERGIRIAESVDPTNVDLEKWRKNRRALATFLRLRQRALKRAYDPADRKAREDQRGRVAQRLRIQLQASPFPAMDL